MGQALDGIRVLDFSRFIAGPSCTLMLAHMGAEVIRVEPPDGEDDRVIGPMSPQGNRIWFTGHANHKKAITLDTKKAEGRELLKRLVAKADVVVHNFVPGTRPALMLHYDALKEVNPRVVVAAVSGYGETGPSAQLGGFDAVMQGLSGMMSFTGMPGTPPMRAGVAWVDYAAGYNMGLGIMFALFHRERGGVGQMVDVALLDAAVFPVVSQGMVTELRLLDVPRRQMGNEGWYAFANCFEAKDGWVVLTAGFDAQFYQLMEAIGRPDLVGDPRARTVDSRWTHHEEMHGIVGEWVGQRTVAEALAALQKHRVPADKVNKIEEMVEHPQVRHREMLGEVPLGTGGEKATVAGSPIKMSRTPATTGGAAPGLGEHNAEVYEGLLGMSAGEVAALRALGAV